MEAKVQILTDLFSCESVICIEKVRKKWWMNRRGGKKNKDRLTQDEDGLKDLRTFQNDYIHPKV